MFTVYNSSKRLKNDDFTELRIVRNNHWFVHPVYGTSSDFSLLLRLGGL